MKILSIAIFLLFAFSDSSSALYTSYNIGQDCGETVSAGIAAQNMDRAYVAGFITGINYYKGRKTEASSQALYQWIVNYCDENPLDKLYTALYALDDELDRRSKE